MSKTISGSDLPPTNTPARPKKPKLGKTVGVQVPPELYERLAAACKAKGIPSIKAALLLAAEAGIDRLVPAAPALASPNLASPNRVAVPHGNKFTASDL